MKPNAGAQPLLEAGARQLGRRKARCILHVSSRPPLRTGLATFMASGSAPVIVLHGDHEASVPISPVPQVSTRVQLARSLGTFVSLFSQARGLRLQSSSWCARLSRAQTTMPHPTLPEGLGVSLGSPLPTSTRLHIPHRSLPCSAWKTQTERDRWRVPLLAPSALCGSPVFGQRVGQVDLCHLCPPSPVGIGPYSQRSYLLSGSTG